MPRRSKQQQVPIQERPVSISIASYITGVETHTLRYWEREFAEFLNPVRTPGGQRRYRPEDLEVLKEIKRLLKDELYTIAGAKNILRQRFPTHSHSKSNNGKSRSSKSAKSAKTART